MPDILSGLATGVIGAGLGLATQGINNRNQLDQQDKLNAQQSKWNAVQNAQNVTSQMDIWNKTNYSAQVDQMKKAGLNPALMYAKGGPGGTTQANTVSNSAPQSAKGTGMEISQGIQQSMQMALLQAQKENIEADTKNKLTDANLKAGATTDNVIANTANTKQNTENAILDGVIKKYTGMEAKDQYELISKPNRGIQSQTYQDELEARQGVAETIYELWQEGKLKDKGLYEIEQLNLQNSKTREETKNIQKVYDMLEQQIKGQKLQNMLDEVETQWAQGTGLKSGNATQIVMKLLDKLIGNKMLRH